MRFGTCEELMRVLVDGMCRRMIERATSMRMSWREWQMWVFNLRCSYLNMKIELLKTGYLFSLGVLQDMTPANLTIP